MGRLLKSLIWPAVGRGKKWKGQGLQVFLLSPLNFSNMCRIWRLPHSRALKTLRAPVRGKVGKMEVARGSPCGAGERVQAHFSVPVCYPARIIGKQTPLLRNQAEMSVARIRQKIFRQSGDFLFRCRSGVILIGTYKCGKKGPV